MTRTGDMENVQKYRGKRVATTHPPISVEQAGIKNEGEYREKRVVTTHPLLRERG